MESSSHKFHIRIISKLGDFYPPASNINDKLYKIHHPQADVGRLYVKREGGGRGLL
jgi:hypothetical protein